ncbi:MAG: phosphoenolpyruvate carboxykinase (ATP) [Gemmataceae bacterium]
MRHVNLSSAELVEAALARGEGVLTDRGALAVRTGKHTGRSPDDRFLVIDDADAGSIDWGPVNRRMPAEVAGRLEARVRDYLAGVETFVTDAGVCADARHAVPVRVVADTPWQALFARCLFRDPVPGAGALEILAASNFRADPARDGTRSETFIILDLKRVVLVGGTGYAGEVKKAAFSYLNHRLPADGVLPMHCAANVGADGRCAVFFGLSGTGKTTLSADPLRRLIGDDEHGWGDGGVFNFEGGCYPKCIRLTRAGEPQLYDALTFGSVLENVVLGPGRVPDFYDEGVTENTRAAFPLAHVPGREASGRGPHPSHVLFLTCDTFGVVPPLGRLSVEQAMYHFLSGYTAKVAGTEAGVTRPEATFSACFGAPFLPRPAGVYAGLLAEKLRRHGSEVWLVNTGWTGAGKRVALAHTRAMVTAVLSGALDGVPLTPDEVLGVGVPAAVPGVPAEVLRPRAAWADGAAFDAAARRLAAAFRGNFGRYAVDEAVRAAGPR